MSLSRQCWASCLAIAVEKNNLTINLVKGFEGYSSTPYFCSAMVPTIGYGTTRYPNGVKVKINDPSCTKDQAEIWLAHEVSRSTKVVINHSKYWLNNNQLAALVSFVYNVGAGAFRASTLLKRLNSGDWDDIPNQFSRWKFAGGRVVEGLVTRRLIESNMWESGENINDDHLQPNLHDFLNFNIS